ncbi:centrosome-associated protein 350 isoform X5 [Brachyhypopomus gauderio]|uniref:centrosome-associated protein 350 isoform X5 n=1 Tax=Brachyhypopomus gauderio TaxID=698409 RepID=UPI00404144C0
MDCRREISTAWKVLGESKTALRHIENRLDAVAGTGTGVELLNTERVRQPRDRPERRDVGDDTLSKLRPRSQHSPDETSHSRLRGSESNSRKPGDSICPHTPHRAPRAAGHNGIEMPDPEQVLRQLVYDRDSRSLHDTGSDSTRSSALDATTVHYLNDPICEATSGSEVAPVRGQKGVTLNPGSSSVRLEKLRQRQADGKLEKLREMIRRQREQLEETAERERLLGPHTTLPTTTQGPHTTLHTATQGPHTTLPTATVRKVAPAPAAPVYKGFNTSETKIRTSDGKMWGEEDFQNLSKEIYRDLTHHLGERVTRKPPERDRLQEKKASRPVRKVHRSASVPSSDTKPVISTSSWREGQKLVKMMLGSAPRLPHEPRAQSAERPGHTASDTQLKVNCHSRVRSTERPDPHRMPGATAPSRLAGSDKKVPVATEMSKRTSHGDKGPVKEQSIQLVTASRGKGTMAAQTSRPAAVAEQPAGKDKCTSPSRGLLSADIQGILDDLQLEGVVKKPGRGGACRRRNPELHCPAPPTLSRCAGPAHTCPETREQTAPRKRHYDTDTVRQYITRQQEDRKRKQSEQRRSQREEAQRRSQRLQELYRKQREGVARAPAPPPNPVQTRLQETYTKLLLEHTLQQSRSVYQPSGESDKENKRQEPLSSSPSELSVSELGPSPLLSRAALGLGNLYSSWLHAEHHGNSPLPTTEGVPPPGGQLLPLPPEGIMEGAHTAAPNKAGGDLHSDLRVSRVERVEALKARAASLSSRVESEARRLASVPSVPSTCLPVTDDVLCAKPQSPPEREEPPSRLNVQQLLRAGQCVFGGDLPGVGKMDQHHTAGPAPALPVDRCTGVCDSSGTISEGPLSDGSVSEPEVEDALGDPAGVKTHHHKPSVVKGTADYCSTLFNNHAHNPISVFQREAEQAAPFRSALQNNQLPWEELSKGSSHSVINIFTKNIHNYSKVMDESGITPLHGALPAGSSVIGGTAYEDDFISSCSSSQSASRRTANSLSNGHTGGAKDSTANCSPSSTLSSSTSTLSTCSSSRRERRLERTLVERQMNASVVSDLHWNGLRKRDSENSSASGSHRDTDTDGTLGGATLNSVHSVISEVQTFPRSPPASPDSPVDFTRVSPPRPSAHSDVPCSPSVSPSGTNDPKPSSGPAPGPAPNTLPTPVSGGPMHFAPGVLQQRMSAELNYLSAVEESVRQLCDVERVRAVSLAQQESVSLAQILKAQQSRQERDLQLLKIKAEQETLETQRQLQERSVQMTELAQARLLGVASFTPLYDQQRQPLPQTDSSRDMSPGREASQTAASPPHRKHTSSEGDSVSVRRSPSPSLKEEGGATGSGDCRGRSNSSLEEEAHMAIDDSLHTDSIHSMLEDRADSTSVATECSVRYEESVTEDELEKSFRSLLPSESHWRDSVERGRSPLAESYNERGQDSSKLSIKDSSARFSGGQDSFSKFTMAMVKQYMQEEELRARHQSSLLRLRHRALTDKTKAELAWLEHQKKRLRDKGEDDKMPPLRKRQRGLLLRLQQEQAEIRRLQDVNRAARRERHLLLKQQEEIEKIQHTTLKLRQKLRSAGDTNPRSPVSGEMKLAPPSVTVTDVETRSPSPISVSGSETSSIMQKLKKMHYHKDERFLTKREQQLGRRRLQAEELLAWRQRLDAEELVVQRMELQALAVWEPHGMTVAAGGAVQEHSAHSPQAHTSPAASTRLDTSTSKAGSEDESGPCVSSSDVSVSTRGPVLTLSPQDSEFTHSSQANCTVSSISKEPVQGSSRISEPRHVAPVSEAASDQSDVEGRVLVLKAELRRRKAEVQQLKKEQKQRQKERLKAQEAVLLKQLQSYNNFIQKTKAELSRTDAPEAPGHYRPEAGEKLNALSELETQVLLTEPLSENVCHEASVSSEEEASAVTPTPVLGSPDRGSGTPLSLKPQHGTLTRDAYSQLESTARPQVSASVSSEGSEVTEELQYLRGEGRSDAQGSSGSAQFSEPLLKMDLQPPGSAEDVMMAEPCQPGPADRESGEERNSSDLVLNTEESRSPALPSRTDGPDLSPRKHLEEHTETPLPSGHGYSDDFETSLDSSLREDRQSPELTTPSALQPIENLCLIGSKVDIYEELSVGSGTDGGTVHSHSSVDVQSPPKPSNEHICDIAIPAKLLTILTSVEEPLKDAMASYCIGDRVLVNNIHPGSLKFKGQMGFASGFWAGVELDESKGTGDGVCDGVMYFQCKEGHGIFAPPDKISHLTESRGDTTGEEESSFDDNLLEKHSAERQTQQRNLQKKKPETRGFSDGPSDKETKLPQSGNDNFLKSALNMDVFNRDIMEDMKQDDLSNGMDKNVLLTLDLSSHQQGFPIDQEEEAEVHRQEEEQTVDILDLLVSEKSRVEDLKKASDLSCERTSVVDRAVSDGQTLHSLVDKILNSFVCDTVRQFQHIRKEKEQKITSANQSNVSDEDAGEGDAGGEDKTSFPAFFKDQEEVCSPEFCNRSESPVLGPSGQEELAKRLAELELSRELLDVLGDEQDWFDEDFGLSSRKEQQKLRRCRPEQEGLVSASQQTRTPTRHQLPQLLPPQDTAMLVPHTAPEVEKLVMAAVQEIWRECGLGQGHQSVAGVPKPQPSDTFLCDGTNRDEQEAQCLRSYKQAVFDLSWEVMQDMYEDPNTEQTQWARPRRLNSVCIHRATGPSHITKVQAFVTSEVLRLCGLQVGRNQTSDWQKMLKFGRKKRDRVDRILVQELHDEEVLWVSYDEDELFVKMQLADGILEALLKDTAEVLVHIQEKRSKRILC